MHPIKRFLTRFYRDRDVICLSSSPRSGSTWLAETLVKIGRLDWVDEPLRMTEDLSAAGFVARTYMPGAALGIESTMKQVLRGREGYLRVYPSLHRRLLLKFVRFNRMMHWAVERYGLQSSILLVRHPCAVVSSQLAMGLRKNSVWARVETPAPQIPDYLLDVVASVSQRSMSVERVLAINWAVDNAIPLIHEPPANTYFTTYEKLMRFGNTELRDLCAHCGITFREVDIRVPSRTASPDLQQEQQTDKWRAGLSDRAREEVREVVTTIMPEYETVRSSLGLGKW